MNIEQEHLNGAHFVCGLQVEVLGQPVGGSLASHPKFVRLQSFILRLTQVTQHSLNIHSTFTQHSVNIQ
jgi:hypothetical protein